MVVVLIVSQQEGAKKINPQSGHGDQDCLIEGNRHWLKKAGQALIPDKQRDHRKCDGARECSQVSKLPRTEGEALIVCISTRVSIGQSGDQQRTRMGGHVKAVSD
jgi:hypothetical protein